MWRHVGVGTVYATLSRAVEALNPHSFTRYGANEGPCAVMGKQSCVFRAADGCISVLVLEPTQLAPLGYRYDEKGDPFPAES